MTKQFIVVEDRGCEIEYVVFIGSLEACHKWMNRMCCSHPCSNEVHVNNEMYMNGNGDLFTYYITDNLDM